MLAYRFVIAFHAPFSISLRLLHSESQIQVVVVASLFVTSKGQSTLPEDYQLKSRPFQSSPSAMGKIKLWCWVHPSTRLTCRSAAPTNADSMSASDLDMKEKFRVFKTMRRKQSYKSEPAKREADYARMGYSPVVLGVLRLPGQACMRHRAQNAFQLHNWHRSLRPMCDGNMLSSLEAAIRMGHSRPSI
eukprot:717484-Amphidinium_carterae.4